MKMKPSEPDWEQLGLFEGGYEQIVVEFTIHLRGSSDVMQANVVVKDLFTGEWIGALVPVTFLEVGYEYETGDFFAKILKEAHKQLSPF